MFSKIRNYILSGATSWNLSTTSPKPQPLQANNPTATPQQLTMQPTQFQPAPYPTSSLIAKLNRTPNYRTELGMQQYRDAVAIAENPYQPDRRWLYQIYKVVELDDQVIAQKRVAINTVKRAPWLLVDEKGKPVAEKKCRCLQKAWFVKLLETFVDTELWGHSLIEFDPERDDKGEFKRFNLVPREHTRPEFGDIVYNAGDTKGIAYRDNPELKYLVEIAKDPFDLGLYQAVCVPAIYKRYGTMDWARRSERFGAPFLDIKTTSSDQNAINSLEGFAKNFGGNGYIIHDEGDTVEMVESTQSDGHKIYAERIALSDSQISKIMNGQTGTMDEKAFVGSAEVHERVLNDFVYSRLLDIQNFINDMLIPFLVGHGYQLKGTYFQFEELLKKEKSKEDPNDPSNKSDNNDDRGKPAPAEKKKSDATLTYSALYYEAEQLYSDICCTTSQTPPLGVGGNTPPLLGRAGEGNLSIDLNPYMEAAIKRVYEKKLREGQLDAELWKQNFSAIWDAAQDGYGKTLLETKYTDPDKERLAQLQHNAMVFAAFKNHANISDMVKLLKDQNGKPRTWENFRDQAQKLNQIYNVNWLQAEWQSANGAARMAAKWHNIIKEHGEDCILRYETVGDDRVRKSHRMLDGVTLPLKDNFWNKHYPPNGWRCRCTVLVEDDDTTHVPPTTLPNDKELPPTFAFNPGKTNQLFGAEHPYFAGFSDKDKMDISKAMNGIRYDTTDTDTHDKVYLNMKNGGAVIVSKLHNKGERKANVAMAKRIADINGEFIELLEVSNLQGEKSLDAMRNDKIWDCKATETKNGKAAIQNGIKAASKQKAKRVVILIHKEHTYSDMLNGFYASFQEGRAKSIEIVELLFENETILTLPINKIWSGEVKEMLYNHKR